MSPCLAPYFERTKKPTKFNINFGIQKLWTKVFDLVKSFDFFKSSNNGVNKLIQ